MRKTIEQRLAAAGRRTGGALGLFDKAVAELEASAEAATLVYAEAEDEITRLERVSDDASDLATKSRKQAQKIKELIGE